QTLLSGKDTAARLMVDAINPPNEIDSAIHNQLRRHPSGAYVQGTIHGAKRNYLYTGPIRKRLNRDIILHELGHAKDFSKGGIPKYLSLLASRGKYLAPVLALANEETDEYATLVAAAMNTPVLRSEA